MSEFRTTRSFAMESGATVTLPAETNETIETPESMVRVCENCTEYLTCPKVTAEEDNKPACDQFEDNFPAIEEDEENEVN